MSKTYGVTVPMSGSLYIEVQADDEKSAIQAALESDLLTTEKLVEWEAHEYLIRGNVCYATTRQASAEVVD